MYEIDFLGAYDRESILVELRRIAAVTGRPRVVASDLGRRGVGRVGLATVVRKFGSVHGANEAAGLLPSPIRRRSNEELLEIVLDLWNRTLKDDGRRPLMQDIGRYGLPVSGSTIASRFGTWNKALLAAYEKSELERKQTPGKDPAPERSRGGFIARPKAKRRGALSVRTRFLVFKRDLYRCCICRKTGVELQVDHVIPLSQGGSNRPDNLQTLCVACNQGKGASLQ